MPAFTVGLEVLGRPGVGTTAAYERLAEALGRATGKNVELKTVVDPSVIGGVVARVGDQVIDGSIRRRLELARERLSEV